MSDRPPCPICKNPIGTEGCALKRTAPVKVELTPKAEERIMAVTLKEAELIQRMRSQGYNV